jgi:hypothetical protein
MASSTFETPYTGLPRIRSVDQIKPPPANRNPGLLVQTEGFAIQADRFK